MVTGSHGRPLRAHHYYGFGQEYPATSPSITNPEKMRFTGHERDQHGPQGEHLDYMHARYCSPFFGRFMTLDPKRSSRDGGALMAARRALPYQEGSWFAVPLRLGGYALGLAARIDGSGGVFGYFFPVRYSEVPSIDDLKGLTQSDAIYRTQFGDLGLINGVWPVIKYEPTEWRRSDWPMPPFVRVDKSAGKAWMARYSDNTLELLSEMPCDLSLAETHPKDSMAGAGFVEIKLSKLLSDQLPSETKR